MRSHLMDRHFVAGLRVRRGRRWPAALIIIHALLIASGLPVLAQASQEPSQVTGTVQEHETGLPLAGAAVSLASGPHGTVGIGTRVTNSEGRFLFRRVPPGTYRLVVTYIGYRDVRDTLPVSPNNDLELALSMSVRPIELDPILVVTDRADFSPLRGFEERRKTRSGTFIDREEIEGQMAHNFSDLFRMVPGARIIPGRFNTGRIVLRGGCTPTLWVDGMRLSTPEGMDSLLRPMDLEAVEIYHGASLPVEFGSNSCGAVVAWTRRGEPTQGQGSFWKKMGIGAAFALLAYLATS